MTFKIVVVGTSVGGLKALQTLLSTLRDDFLLPVAIVQHREKHSESGLCDFLRRSTSVSITEPEDKEAILPGKVYLAPHDYHLLIDHGAFALSTDPPVDFARPSVDVLFQSAADEFGNQTIGVILTGANRDGARGLASIKKRGGIALVQTPGTASCPQMPEAAIAQTKVDWVLPVEEIGARLLQLSNGNQSAHGS